jgi:hypothetical protein
MSRLDWTHAKQNAALRDERRARDDAHGPRALIMDAERARDRLSVAELLAVEDLFPPTRAWLERLQAYLDKDPAHRLSDFDRHRIDRVNTALTIRKRTGKPAGRTRWEGKLTPPWHRQRAPRPAWMSDPSLLPKRPPGAK